MNNKYIIKAGRPLLRPGITIETEASDTYLVRVINTLMKSIREINNGTVGTTITGTGDTKSIITTAEGAFELFPDGTRNEPIDPNSLDGLYRNTTIS